MEGLGDDVEVVEEQEDEAATQAQIDDAPVVKLINGILTDAVKRGASDIHIEPFEHEIRVRYRIDGALHEVMKPPLKMKAALISRIKIMAQLNIAERRVPQDGRIKLKMGNRVIDFRVSTLPVLFGEKIVLRILDKGNLTLDLTKFGFEPQGRGGPDEGDPRTRTAWCSSPARRARARRRRSTRRSRRSTRSTSNIMTAEDPVEYNLMGINQVLVRNEIGLTFAAALKAFLRQDPNIIMVGEIRDLETGGIAIKAALTGHLVLSTLHTNDAPSTVTRLIDMGLEPFNVASAVNLVVAQRLVRRICKDCKAPATYRRRGAARPWARILSRCEAIPFFKGTGLRHLQRHRLQGPRGPLRGHGAHARAAPADPRGASVAGAPRPGGHGGHADPAHGRHR